MICCNARQSYANSGEWAGPRRFPPQAAGFFTGAPGARPAEKIESDCFMPIRKTSNGRNVLLVEDDGNLRRTLSEYLEENGFQVFAAARGKAASRLLERVVPDIVILDVTLPDRNGLEICKWIKNENRLSGVPVVMISGKTALKDKLAGFLSGAEKYLCKPFEMEDLLEFVNNALGPRVCGPGSGLDTLFREKLI